MPITSIKRDWGVDPSTVRITSTDTLATVSGSGYMTLQIPVTTALNGGPFGFVVGDVVLVSAADGSEQYNFAGDDFSTLIPNSSGIDDNGNISANNFLEGYYATVTAAGTTTLTIKSAEIQNFTGITTQTVVLPNVTTLVLGLSFTILNNSTGVVTVKSNDLSTIQAMAANTQMRVICVSITDESAAGWDSDYTLEVLGVSTITGTANQVIASSPSGDVTLSLPQSIGTANTPVWANVLLGYATTATAAATTTLTTLSKYLQYFTGVTTQTVVLPVTGTLVLGQSYKIVNNSTGVVTVQSSGANTIQAMAAGSTLIVTCILTSGTTAASWNAEYTIEADISGAVLLSPSADQTITAYNLILGTGGLLVNGGEIVAGSSAGTGQGTLTLYSGTAAKGNFSLASMDNHGDFEVLIENASFEQASTITVPDPGASTAAFLLNTSDTAQIINYQLIAPSFSPNTTSGIIGTTTNDNAAAGSVGEYQLFQILYADSVSISNGVLLNAGSITIGAGDWDVVGNVGFYGAAGTVVTRTIAGFGLTNATLEDPSQTFDSAIAFTAGGMSPQNYALPTVRMSVAAPTTLYFNFYATFSVSTLSVFGFLAARRVR